MKTLSKTTWVILMTIIGMALGYVVIAAVVAVAGIDNSASIYLTHMGSVTMGVAALAASLCHLYENKK